MGTKQGEGVVKQKEGRRGQGEEGEFETGKNKWTSLMDDPYTITLI